MEANVAKNTSVRLSFGLENFRKILIYRLCPIAHAFWSDKSFPKLLFMGYVLLCTRLETILEVKGCREF